jgi:hypothetical protein
LHGSCVSRPDWKCRRSGELQHGTIGGTDYFGLSTEKAGAVKIGDTSLVLILGGGNDEFLVGIAGAFNVNEQ